MSAGGFGGGDSKGSAALAGETTEQYVARQRRLQAEARARMRAKFGGQGAMGGVGSNSDYDPKTGTYGGGGLAGLGQGDISLDNVQNALGQGVGKLRSWGSQLAEEETVRDLGSKTGEVAGAAWHSPLPLHASLQCSFTCACTNCPALASSVHNSKSTARSFMLLPAQEKRVR